MRGDVTEKIRHHILYKELRAAPPESPVLGGTAGTASRNGFAAGDVRDACRGLEALSKPSYAIAPSVIVDSEAISVRRFAGKVVPSCRTRRTSPRPRQGSADAGAGYEGLRLGRGWERGWARERRHGLPDMPSCRT